MYYLLEIKFTATIAKLQYARLWEYEQKQNVVYLPYIWFQSTQCILGRGMR